MCVLRGLVGGLSVVTPRRLSNSLTTEGSSDPRRCSGLKPEGASFRLTLALVGGEDDIRVMKVESESSEESSIDVVRGGFANAGNIIFPFFLPRVDKSSQDRDKSAFDGGLALSRDDSEQRFSVDFDKLRSMRFGSSGSRYGIDPDRGLCLSGDLRSDLRSDNDDVECGLIRCSAFVDKCFTYCFLFSSRIFSCFS